MARSIGFCLHHACGNEMRREPIPSTLLSDLLLPALFYDLLSLISHISIVLGILNRQVLSLLLSVCYVVWLCRHRCILLKMLVVHYGSTLLLNKILAKSLGLCRFSWDDKIVNGYLLILLRCLWHVIRVVLLRIRF